jgi:zinc protease
MSKSQKSSPTKSTIPGYIHVRTVGDITEYRLKANGLTVLYKQIPDTGVVTTNITYRVGAKDEITGETGLAHMLEHMLFKPTKQDLKKKIDSGAMQFERETGCTLNANTWQDRTTYFFSYPREHFTRALTIEAERMVDVVLTDKEFLPERNNVLSEFDMYFGDPHFALNQAMMATAFHSHPYSHETIGFRQDIEAYTPAKLERFYRNYYRPENATMMVIGDIDAKTALAEVRKCFEHLKNPATPIPRIMAVEPKQEGLRRVSIVRPSSTNLLIFGAKHAGMPETEWFVMSTLLAVLTDGPESILHKALVDTGRVTAVEGSLNPGADMNMASLTITLAPGTTHAEIEAEVRALIGGLTPGVITPLMKKVVARTLTDEYIARTSSLRIAMELTEYVATGNWSVYFDTEKTLKSITAKDLLGLATRTFDESQLTIGYFIGTK